MEVTCRVQAKEPGGGPGGGPGERGGAHRDVQDVVRVLIGERLVDRDVSRHAPGGDDRDLLLEGWANEAAGLRRGISLLAAD